MAGNHYRGDDDVRSDILVALHEQLNRIEPLGHDAWADAARCLYPRRFPSGAHVLEAGQVASHLYFILSGVARFYYLHPEGREFNKSFATRGEVLASISSLAMDLPSSFSVQALTTCECVGLSHRDLLGLSEQYRDWNRLRIRLLEMLAIKKERREADFLLLSAQERYEKFLREYAEVAGPIPNYHIASYLGITEQALSRIRRRLRLTRVNASEPG
jgi:CRP-like cAMP-binding protein